ncbi:hypothetical protein C8R47DRAFT_138754 [Mycena vitilis]|nr:hypothetical protein C8R47DRAFT_138754 [Mycena vitilis]
MNHNYALRVVHRTLPDIDGADGLDLEEEAASTVGAPSSPVGPMISSPDFPVDVRFADVGSDDPVFQDDDTEFGENTRAPRRSDEEKAIAVLQFMKQTLGRFSLRLLFQTLLTSDNGAITNSTNMYFQSGGAKHLLELGVGDRWKRDKELVTRTSDMWGGRVVVGSGRTRLCFEMLCRTRPDPTPGTTSDVLALAWPGSHGFGPLSSGFGSSIPEARPKLLALAWLGLALA